MKSASKDEARAARAAAARRYQQSEKGRRYWKAYSHSPRGRYNNHKQRAKGRGIEWKFTFETWWAMWEPHFHNIGKKRDQFHMCRKNDEGPYSPENCRIDTAANNGKEAVETRKRRQQCQEDGCDANSFNE